MRLPRKPILLLIVLVGILFVWVYWNRPTKVDMAIYVPADCLAYIESNDLTQIASGIDGTEAWKSLAAPLGASSSLLPNRWLIRLARWTGIGSANAVLAARSQVALVFNNAQATESDTTLTIKPLAALIIETHTSQRRMRLPIQNLAQEFARNAYGEITFTQKQTDGVEINEWSALDGTRHLVVAFIDTLAIIGNDETLVTKCVDVHRGRQAAIAGERQLEKLRSQASASAAALFGFIPKRGVKPILQTWWLKHENQSDRATAVAEVFSSTIGNLIDGFGWSVRFDQGGTEDRCFISLSDGVADKLRNSIVPDTSRQILDLSFVPPDSDSVSVYEFRDLEGAWRDLNALISSHADVLGAVASRPLLRSILKPYGIEDADIFARSAGPHFQTIRLQDRAAVLVAEAYDPPTLRKLVQQRLGADAKTETSGDTEILLSITDNWSASFPGNYLLIGPSESVRHSIQTKQQSQSISSVNSFQRAQAFVDVSLPITSVTFSSDREAAISFVELFSHRERSVFSTNAAAIQQASNSLPYAVSVTILRADGFEWTSRSSFGLLGSLFTTFAPGKSS